MPYLKPKKKKINKTQALVRYSENGRTRTNSKSLSRKKDLSPVGRLDIVASRMLGVLVGNACKDLGMEGLAQELNPMIENRMRPLGRIKVAPELMAVGKAIMQKMR